MRSDRRVQRMRRAVYPDNHAPVVMTSGDERFSGLPYLLHRKRKQRTGHPFVRRLQNATRDIGRWVEAGTTRAAAPGGADEARGAFDIEDVHIRYSMI